MNEKILSLFKYYYNSSPGNLGHKTRLQRISSLLGVPLRNLGELHTEKHQDGFHEIWENHIGILDINTTLRQASIMILESLG
jgi:hypothetical protein